MVLDVGEGDCTIVVDDATKEALLVDCRSGYDGTAVRALAELGCNSLDAAVVTHSHLDHLGGVLDVIERLVNQRGASFAGLLYINHDTLKAMTARTAAQRPSPKGTQIRAHRRRVLELYEEVLQVAGRRVKPAIAEMGPQQLGSTMWTLLAPSYADVIVAVRKGDPNLASGILHIESDGQSMIIGGDAQLSSWQAISAQLPTGAVVRWPHHGGRISNSRTAQGKLSDQSQLLKLLQPSHVLVSVGGNNPHGHPQNEFFQAVQQRKLAPICTQATSKCTGGSNGAKCAGSITIELGTGSGPRVTPERSNHAQFVATLANPQCT
ncbi:MAG: MBL fold metallo-hydrolase [Acidimicrobiaceae bacterium]|nr:MBL fold metallo-hydrolase [Acidimicrobiaceae bacterium]